MALRHRVICSLTALTVGIIASLPFYRRHDVSLDVSQRGGVTTPSAVGALESAAIALQITAEETNQESQDAKHSSPKADAHDDKPPSSVTSTAPRSDQIPPGIASEFPDVSQRVPEMQRQANRPLSVPAAEKVSKNFSSTGGQESGNDLPPHATADISGDGPPRTARADTREKIGTEARQPKLHRIRDGDTLQHIAQRYLGSVDRWLEILNANRDVIHDPELLPVGRQIRIPEGITRETAPIATGATPPSSTANDPPLTTLVPIR